MSEDAESSDSSLLQVNSQHAFLALVVIALSTAVWCSRRELQKLRSTSQSDHPTEPLSIPMDSQDIGSSQRDKSLPRSKERRKRGKEANKERTSRKALQAALREKPSDPVLRSSSHSKTSSTDTTRSSRASLHENNIITNTSPTTTSAIPKITVNTPQDSNNSSSSSSSPRPLLDLTPTLSAPMVNTIDGLDTSDSDSTTFSVTGTSSTAASEVSVTTPHTSLPPKMDSDTTITTDDDPVPFPTLAPVNQPEASTSKMHSQAAYERLQRTLTDTTLALDAARLETEEAQLREEAANAEIDQMRAELTSAHWRWSEERAAWARRELELQNHINYLMQHVQAYAQALTFTQTRQTHNGSPSGLNGLATGNQRNRHTRHQTHQHRSTPSSPARGATAFSQSPVPQPYIPVPPLSLSIPMYDTNTSSSSSPASSAAPSPASITNPLPPSLTVSPTASSLPSPMQQHAFTQFLPLTPSHLSESLTSSRHTSPETEERGRPRAKVINPVTKNGSDTLLMESLTSPSAITNSGELSESLADAIFRRPEVILSMPDTTTPTTE